MYHTIIVGGGVAGLHTGIRVAKEGKTCCIIDEYHCGGRIQTYHNKKYHWENGAGRISTDHHLTMGYLKKYGLTLIPLSTEIDYLSKNGVLTDNPFFALQNTFLSLLHSIPKHVLATKTLREILREVMPNETDFYNAFPYYAELAVLRADLALESFASEMGTHRNFVVCKEGLSEMVHHMKEDFIALGGTIIQNMKADSIESVNDLTFVHAVSRETQERFMYHAPVCVLAVPHDSLQKILSIPSVTSVVKHLKSVPLLRIYMVFPKQKTPWFSTMNSTVIDGPIRYIIPINDTTIMISYTEGPYATHWMNMKPDDVCDHIINQLRDFFPNQNIPDPVFMKMHPWRQGCSYWLPGSYNVDEQSLKILNPKRGIFVCGESYARKQCWIESALEHAELLWSHPEFIKQMIT